MAVGTEEVEDLPEREIVRVKRFEVLPMGVEEAIEQMELLGHDFFLFYNAEEAMINLIYRRRDGNYGLLQPEGP
jgi:putative sigma-54 modulation protein